MKSGFALAAAMAAATLLLTIADPSSAQGRPHAFCDAGDSSQVRGAGGRQTLECISVATTWVRRSYRACPPGSSMRSPPTEANDGGDLCNLLSGLVAGPALPCFPINNQNRMVIVRGGRDRCEERVTSHQNRPVRIRN